MLRTRRRDSLPEALFIPHCIILVLDKHPTGTCILGSASLRWDSQGLPRVVCVDGGSRRVFPRVVCVDEGSCRVFPALFVLLVGLARSCPARQPAKSDD